MTRDPVDMMLDIAERFLQQASELDQRVQAAIDADASHGDIVSLMNLAATDRLRALSAAQAAAPFVKPKLQAIEVSPVTPITRSKFEQRLQSMCEAEVLANLKRIAAGTLAIEVLASDEDDDDEADSAFIRAARKMAFEEVQDLYRALVNGDLAVSPHEKLQALARNAKRARFLAWLNSLSDADLDTAYCRLTEGIPSAKLMKEFR